MMSKLYLNNNRLHDLFIYSKNNNTKTV